MALLPRVLCFEYMYLFLFQCFKRIFMFQNDLAECFSGKISNFLSPKRGIFFDFLLKWMMIFVGLRTHIFDKFKFKASKSIRKRTIPIVYRAKPGTAQFACPNVIRYQLFHCSNIHRLSDLVHFWHKPVVNNPKPHFFSRVPAAYSQNNVETHIRKSVRNKSVAKV